MPAPFAAQLCGYRDGKPNTSDASQRFSVDLGTAFFDVMGVPRTAQATKSVGDAMRDAMVEDLRVRLSDQADHLRVWPEKKLAEFEQYAHLGAVQELSKDVSGESLERAISALEAFASQLHASSEPALYELVQALRAEHTDFTAQRRLLLDTLGEESVLGLDVTIDRPSPYQTPSPLPHLVAGFSLKWSLRTDRAQDCRSQGAKMASLRRGRMPHFAAVTMEPRPYFLAILGRGSGEVDCVYHLDLPALGTAIDQVTTGRNGQRTRELFHRLCEQGRLRDYDDLVEFVATL